MITALFFILEVISLFDFVLRLILPFHLFSVLPDPFASSAMGAFLWL
tara:strand:- start:1519 stop:1659 length:141 start_codon:yes stop_codon:yes gene_type:complete